MKQFIQLLFSFTIMTFFSVPALAVPVMWTDWTSSVDNFSASGELIVGVTTVDVDYSATSSHSFVQTGAGGNFWWGTAYTNGTVDNAPTPAELVALRLGGTVTVTFSEAILNPYIAMNSWNSNVVDFGEPIQIDSFGRGFWGTGTANLNTSGTGFTGVGEFHGVISLQGSFNQISFTHTSENWHGFTIGVAGLGNNPPPSIPEPTSLALIGLGLAGLGFARKNDQ